MAWMTDEIPYVIMDGSYTMEIDNKKIEVQNQCKKVADSLSIALLLATFWIWEMIFDFFAAIWRCCFLKSSNVRIWQVKRLLFGSGLFLFVKK